MNKRQLPPGVYLDRKSGRFIAKVRLGGVMTRAVSFDSVADAVEHLAAVRAAYRDSGSEPRKNGPTFGEWLTTWLDRREASGRYRDLKNDRGLLDRYVGEELRARPVRELRQRDIRAWLYDLANREAVVGGRPKDGERPKGRGRPIARQTVANALNLVRAALAEAVDAGRASSNPAMGLRPPRATATTREHTGFLSADQVRKLIHHRGLSDRLRWIYTVAIWTGLREGELWGLRWEHVILDGPRPELVVSKSFDGPTKGGRVRRVPLLGPARDALRSWRSTFPVTPIAGLVWPSPKRKSDGTERCHSKGYDAEWRRWAPRAGIEMPFKQARHTCGCHLIMGTWGPPMPMEAVQAWLGHQSITTTERFYAKYAPERLHSYRAAIDSESSAKSSAAGLRRKDEAPEPS